MVGMNSTLRKRLIRARSLLSFKAIAAPKKTWSRMSLVGIATGGFVGFFPVAPGTVGSLVGLGLAWCMGGLPVFIQCAGILGLSLVGVIAIAYATSQKGYPDPGWIVIDEVVGIWIALLGMPLNGYWLFWGFVIFRFFDIVKLPPANWVDKKVKNAWGVMLDDVVAGLYTNVLLHLMLRGSL